MRTHLVASLACLAAAASLAGCSASSASSLDSLDLDSTAALVHLVNYNEDFTEMTDKILVIGQDGQEKVLTLGDSSGLGLDWSDDSLFYSTGTADTWLRPGEKAVSVANDVAASMPAEDAEMLAFGGSTIARAADSITRIIDRVGMNKSVRTLASENSSENTLIDDVAPLISCGDAIYSFGPGSFDEDGNSSDIALRRVWDGSKLESTSVARNPVLLDTVLNASGACSPDGTQLYVFASYVAMGEGKYSSAGTVGADLDFAVEDYFAHVDEMGDVLLTVETWNLESGERTIHPISKGTEAFLKVGDLAFQSGVGGCSFSNDSLYWVDDLGRVVRTDPATGASDAISGSLQQAESLDEIDDVTAKFREGKVDILVNSMLDLSHDRLVTIDLTNGDTIAEYPIPGFGGLVKEVKLDDGDEEDGPVLETDSYVMDFVVNPAL